MELRPGYKQTEVGLIPADWEVASIGSIASFKSGDGINVAALGELSSDTPIPVYGGNGIAGYAARALVQQRVVVVGRVGQKCGEVYITDGPAWITDNALYPRTFFRKIDVRLLALALKRAGLNGVKNRNDLPLITQSILHSVRIPLPPTDAEQEAIAEALSDADALIESLEQLLAKKRQLKQGAMQELLTGKKRLPGFEIRPGYEQSEAGVIPEDWSARRLSEEVKLTSGLHVLAQHCNTDGDGVAYITGPADFSTGVIQHSKYTTRPGAMCGANDILVTVKGSGAGTLVLSNAEYCISRQLMAVRVNGWNTAFVYFSLLRDVLLFGASATGLIPGLSRGDILSKAIPLPPTQAEQTAIAAILSDMDTEIAALEAKLTKARALKQGMMQELLTGRIRLV